MKKNLKISIIVAATTNGVIGLKNGMPWNLPKDMQYFISNTKNKIVIMGKNTFLSLNEKPLKNRINIVVSNTYNKSIEYDNLYVVNNLDDAITLGKNLSINFYPNNNEIFIIGGSSIYKQVLDNNLADFIYLTQINTTLLDGDSFFTFNLQNYKLISSNKEIADKNNKYDLDFQIFEKI